MDDQEAQRLRDAGFGVGTVQELANLSDAEAALVEIALALHSDYREGLAQTGKTTDDLAEQLGTKTATSLEDGAPTIGCLIGGLLILGATFEEIGKTIAAVTLPTG